jgi:Transposase DDE domain group 1
MPRFKIELTDDLISSNSGLVFIGEVLKHVGFDKHLSGLTCIKSMKKIPSTDILRAYLGMLCIGKNSFESIDDYKNDPYFRKSLGIQYIPSKETLRQRLEELSVSELESGLKAFNGMMLKRFSELETVLDTNMIPVDFDVTPMDNSKSHKEGVSHTYKQFMGYAPMMTYIGGTGYMLNNQFREGKAHSNCDGTRQYIRETLDLARTITSGTLLARFDSGNDSAENILEISSFDNVHYLIKQNFRREDRSLYIHYVQGMASVKETPRHGKTIYYASRKIRLHFEQPDGELKEIETRQVLRFIERTIDKQGNCLLMPDHELDAWFTDLPEGYTEQDVIVLYTDHGTSEQFHSEFKTDMDMERLPSGKFATNSLVMVLGMLAFNLLRIIGQQSLKTGLIKRKRSVQRIRIRKVLQDIMYMACQFMIKCKCKTLKLARSNAYSQPLINAYTLMFAS